MNTGGKNNIGNGAIHAILPYLLQEDIFCFLDDDNWYDENHVKYLAEFIQQHQLDYAYSLRKVYTSDYQFLCDDNFESLGFWKISATETMSFGKQKYQFSTEDNPHFIDTNTYAITREISFSLSSAWYSGIGNDKQVFNTLLQLNVRGGCTAKRTAHYKLNSKLKLINTDFVPQEYFWQFFKKKSEEMAKTEMAWSVPTLYIDGKLIPLT